MIPAAFEYVRAATLEHAFAALEEGGDEAKLIAGGHSLIPAMKLRMAAPSRLIDISRIPGLAGISAGAGGGRIGALTSHAALAASDALRSAAPALWDAANVLGDPQVRNRGTIGGACAHADPAADYPAVLVALDARLELSERGNRREIAASEFFRGLFETALGAREIVTAIVVPAAPQSAYVKFPHPASHYAVVGVAAALELDAGTIRAARIACAGVGDAPMRALTVERALAGVRAADAQSVRAACAGAATPGDARSDTFASATYRAAMADVYAARAVARAASR